MEIPSEGSITLDRRAFKALASETRVEILKKLDGTQMTVSDLARDLNMNKATMFEHLEQLVEVGLVRKDNEEERATTVKTVGTEAPVQGPPKKWVYYRLTWKGKNVLHPERVKIAILLCSAALAVAIAALLYFAAYAPTTGPTARDTSPPMAVGWDIGPARPGSAVELSVTAQDYQHGKVSGIDPDRCVLQWGVARTAASTIPDLLDWSRLQFQASEGWNSTTLSTSVPAMNWTMFNGSYLLVGAQLYDRAGNSAWFYDTAGIRTANQPELRFVAGSQRLARAGTSSYYWSVTAIVENTGLATSGPVIVGLYQYDPDPGRTGKATEQPLAQTTIGPVSSGGTANVQLEFSTRTIRTHVVYLMLDTNGSQPDADRRDNLLTVSLPPEAVPKAMASKGFTPGFELAATVAAAAMALVLVRRLRNLRG